MSQDESNLNVTFPSSNTQFVSLGVKLSTSLPSSYVNTFPPINISIQIESISVVEPESLATNPLPWISGLGFTLEAINDEFSSVLLPYIFGSRNGISALVIVS